jgi:hypothetical protein
MVEENKIMTCHDVTSSLQHLMSNNGSQNQGISELRFPSHSNTRDAPFLLDAGFSIREMQRKPPDTPTKPFFGAGGSMLRQFDEHHAGLTRKSSVESATATPPRSVVGIGGKGAQTWSYLIGQTKHDRVVYTGCSRETRLF